MRKIYLGILTIAVIGCIVIGLCIHTGIGKTGLSFGGSEVKQEVLYDAASGQSASGTREIASLLVQTDIVDVKIAAGDTLTVTYSGEEKFRPEVLFENGTLEVRQQSKGLLHFFLGTAHCALDITLPEKEMPGHLSVRTNTGSIRAEDVSAEKLECESDTGEIQLQDCTAAQTRLKTDTGAIHAEQTDAGELAVRSDTGAVTMTGCTFKNADVDTDTGAVRLTGIDYPGNYSLDLSSDVGSITVDDEKMKGQYRYQNGNSGLIRIKTDTGSITVSSR